MHHAGPAKADIVAALRRALGRGLGDRTVSGEELARRLSMHRRTLNRRLEAEGTTFREVLDAVRYKRACELLRNPNLSIADISPRLGYGEPSAFSRAFRRWSGMTPLQWRARRGG